MVTKNKSKILKEMKELLLQYFSDNIHRVILFGSQNDGNPKEHSDYDILIVLKNDYDWKLENQIYSVTYDIDLKYDIVTDIKIISLKELKTIKGKEPFILDALETGLTV